MTAKVAPTAAAPSSATPRLARRRLLELAPRRHVVAAVGVGGALAGLVVLQAWLLADVVAGALGGQDLEAVRGRLVALGAVVVARAALAWASEVLGHRAAVSVTSSLRSELGRKVVALGPPDLDGVAPGALASLASVGIDALDAFYARYLPQVQLAVMVPVVVVVSLATQSWLAAVLVGVTVPLIPLFMVLVGHTTRVRTERRAAALDRLAGHFLDVVAGLPTLRIFRRARAQAETIRSVTDRYRTTTMATLRLAFLSSLVLELVATLSVAVVAVAVGLRLLDGGISFEAALFALVVAPEAYLPMRNLGASYHAIGDGLAAAQRAFELLDRPVDPARAGRTRPSSTAIAVAGLEVVHPGRESPSLVLDRLDVEVGERVAVTGASGAGKSTLLAVLLGLTLPSAGRVLLGGVSLEDVDLAAWRATLAWVPQRPHLFAGSLRENLLLGTPHATDEDLDAALEAACLTDVVANLSHGLDTRLGPDGAGLSVGERQRVALARSLLRDAALLVLDEPTAALDAATEERVLAALATRTEGRTVVLVAHRPSLVALADRTVHVSAPRGAS